VERGQPIVNVSVSLAGQEWLAAVGMTTTISYMYRLVCLNIILYKVNDFVVSTGLH